MGVWGQNNCHDKIDGGEVARNMFEPIRITKAYKYNAQKEDHGPWRNLFETFMWVLKAALWRGPQCCM